MSVESCPINPKGPVVTGPACDSNSNPSRIPTEDGQRPDLAISDRHAARDVAERKIEALGQMARGVAHDFNNLLAVIRGYTDLILIRLESSEPKLADHLAEINATVDRAANLTQQLSALGRMQLPSLQRVDPASLMTRLADSLASTAGPDIRIACECAPNVPCVMADSGLLQQAASILLSNALAAMPSGGALSIAFRRVCVRDPFLHGLEARAGEFAALAVTDQGAEIPADKLCRVFDPYFTSIGRGKVNGLALATVCGIARQHGGWVEVSSEPDRGTTFTMFIPACQPSQFTESSGGGGGGLRGGSECILLVEQHLPTRLVSRKVLEAYGYHVHEACSGLEALDAWDSRIQEVDLLLAGVGASCGTSALEAARQFRARKPGLKVLFTTGDAGETIRQNAGLEGFGDCSFVPKAGSTHALIESVRRCLDQ